MEVRERCVEGVNREGLGRAKIVKNNRKDYVCFKNYAFDLMPVGYNMCGRSDVFVQRNKQAA